MNLHKNLPLLPLLVTAAHGELRAPYTTDVHSPHLFHLDEAAGGSAVTNSGNSGLNAFAVDGNPNAGNTAPYTAAQPVTTAILGAAGLSGFGKAADIQGGVAALDLGIGVDANNSGGFQIGRNLAAAISPDAVLHSSLTGSLGSLTVEAMIKLDSTTPNGQQIVSTEASGSARGFQFRINADTLEIIFIGGTSINAPIPATGDNAFVAGEWFHVAMVYDGSSGTDNTKLFWTRVNAAATEANLIGMGTTLTTTLGSVQAPIMIGNEARNTLGGPLRGIVDEVRISRIPRKANDFLFFLDAEAVPDGLDDNWELEHFGDLDETDTDTDLDGFINSIEEAAGSDPDNINSIPSDTDADELDDLVEYATFGNLDTDGADDDDNDLVSNADEINAGTDPTDRFSFPDTEDGIGDGLNNAWEVLYFGDLTQEPFDDSDSDGFVNTLEYRDQTLPDDILSNSSDLVDTDGLVDAFENAYFGGYDELPDGLTDADAATNLEEQNAGSDPSLTASTPTDADGDSIPDSTNVLQPYTVDSNTLHLWHLDEVAGLANDSVPGGIRLVDMANGASLWDPSVAGFKTGLNTSAGRGAINAASLSALPNVSGNSDDVLMSYAGADGAFTFEAIVRIDFDPTAVQPDAFNSRGMQIISGESDSDNNANRVWQFRIVPLGTINAGSAPRLEFINLRGEVAVQSITADLPTGADPNAITQGGWYHVVVAYNGSENTADNLKLYWTLLDPSRTAASQLAAASMVDDLLADSVCDFAIGNPTFAVRWFFGSESLRLRRFSQKVFTTGYGFRISGGGCAGRVKPSWSSRRW